MKPLPRKTQLAIALMSQAHVLKAMGTAGLDDTNVKKLIDLLKDAAKSLDSKVRAIKV